MSLKKTIFLETSLQIRRALIAPLHSNAIKAQVPCIYITAPYIWMEFQRTVVADYIHVHRLAHNYKEWSLLLIHLLEGQRAFRPRSAVRSRVERLLAAVLADPRAALGQAACWPLGDVIIALQVPPAAAIWTLDPDFAPLAAALGRQLYEPA